MYVTQLLSYKEYCQHFYLPNRDSTLKCVKINIIYCCLQYAMQKELTTHHFLLIYLTVCGTLRVIYTFDLLMYNVNNCARNEKLRISFFAH